MDCFLIPSDEHVGKLVHHNPTGLDFRGKIEPGLFASLYGLLGSLIPEADIPRTEIRMVISRLKDEQWSYYRFAAPEDISRKCSRSGDLEIIKRGFQEETPRES